MGANVKLVSGFVLISLGLLGAYLFAFPRPADVYALTVAETYDRLAKAELMPGGKSFYGTMQFSTLGNRRDTITWQGQSSHAMRSCKLQLAPWEKDADKTRVTVTCKGGGVSDGAAAGMAHNLFRNAVIERIDSTLDGRAYDKSLAMGSTASGWPGDGVDGSLGTATKNAITMARDVAAMQKEADEAERRRKEQAEWDSYYESDSISFEDQRDHY